MPNNTDFLDHYHEHQQFILPDDWALSEYLSLQLMRPPYRPFGRWTVDGPFDVLAAPFYGLLKIILAIMGFVSDPFVYVFTTFYSLFTLDLNRLWDTQKALVANLLSDIQRFISGLAWVVTTPFTLTNAFFRTVTTLVKGHGIEGARHYLKKMCEARSSDLRDWRSLADDAMLLARKHMTELKKDPDFIYTLFYLSLGDAIRFNPHAATLLFEAGFRLPKDTEYFDKSDQWKNKPMLRSHKDLLNALVNRHNLKSELDTTSSRLAPKLLDICVTEDLSIDTLEKSTYPEKYPDLFPNAGRPPEVGLNFSTLVNQMGGVGKKTPRSLEVPLVPVLPVDPAYVELAVLNEAHLSPK